MMVAFKRIYGLQQEEVKELWLVMLLHCQRKAKKLRTFYDKDETKGQPSYCLMWWNLAKGFQVCYMYACMYVCLYVYICLFVYI